MNQDKFVCIQRTTELNQVISIGMATESRERYTVSPIYHRHFIDCQFLVVFIVLDSIGEI